MLDEKDKKILEVLQEHGDYTTRQIAKKTLLPITTIHNRIRKLKKEKIIKKFTIEIEPKAINKSFLVYILISVNLPFLKKHKKSQYVIAKEIKRFGFVERIDIVSGGTDLVATIRVKDVEEFDKVLLGKLQQIEGIKDTRSMIVIHEG
jgi:Lrp/AsnC family transcriptional regulator, leucine-responsive regulatory protein